LAGRLILGLTANRRIEVMTPHRSAPAIAAALIAASLFVFDGKTGTLLAQTTSNPPPPCPAVTTGAIGGAARGATRGVIIGAISGNAGRGAAIGAAVGGIGGAARRATARANGACY
jgi:Glycine-zipper domain